MMDCHQCNTWIFHIRLHIINVQVKGLTLTNATAVHQESDEHSSVIRLFQNDKPFEQ